MQRLLCARGLAAQPQEAAPRQPEGAAAAVLRLGQRASSHAADQRPPGGPHLLRLHGPLQQRAAQNHRVSPSGPGQPADPGGHGRPEQDQHGAAEPGEPGHGGQHHDPAGQPAGAHAAAGVGARRRGVRPRAADGAADIAEPRRRRQPAAPGAAADGHWRARLGRLLSGLHHHLLRAGRPQRPDPGGRHRGDRGHRGEHRHGPARHGVHSSGGHVQAGGDGGGEHVADAEHQPEQPERGRPQRPADGSGSARCDRAAVSSHALHRLTHAGRHPAMTAGFSVFLLKKQKKNTMKF